MVLWGTQKEGKGVEISKVVTDKWRSERPLWPLKVERLLRSVAGILETGTPKLLKTAEVQLSFYNKLFMEVSRSWR